MKQLLLITISLAFCLSSWAQKEIKLEDVGNNIGDSITVKGEIFGVRYLQSAKNTPTFINVGGAYPNQLLTIVIWGDLRKKLGYAPEEEKYTQGMAVVSGKVELFKGKPQIVIVRADEVDHLRPKQIDHLFCWRREGVHACVGGD